VSREVHAGFCERRRVRLPPATLRVVHCKSRRQAEDVLSYTQMLWIRVKRKAAYLPG